LNAEKSQPPAQSLEVFNVVLAQQSLRVSEGRMRDFEVGVRGGNQVVSGAIIGYVRSINRDQAGALDNAGRRVFDKNR
jgi:hypothetical protein